MTLFEGSGVALITPFNDSKEINYELLEKLINWHIKSKTDAIVICGTTGESSSLTFREKVELIEFTVNKVKKRIKVIANTGTNNTKESILLSQEAERLGVDGLLVITPYYNKPTQEGMYEHFKVIAESVKIPIILYNVPGRTAVNLSVETIVRLSRISNIIGIKEASGDISYVTKIASKIPSFDIYSGNDDQYLALLSLGAKGVISVSANIIPKEISASIKNFKENKYEALLRLKEIHDAMFIETSPAPVKYVLNQLGVNVGGLRLPLVEVTLHTKEILDRIVKEYGLEITL